MTWAAGSPPLVTVTTTGNHNIAGNTYQAANLDGTYTLQLEVGGGGGGLNPSGYCPPATQPVPTGDGSSTIRVTVTGATTFTYPGVPNNPGTFVHGEWNYPLRYAIRCRTVKETLISANQVPVAVGFASVDLDYGGTAATQHRNNVFTGLDGRLWMDTSVRYEESGGLEIYRLFRERSILWKCSQSFRGNEIR